MDILENNLEVAASVIAEAAGIFNQRLNTQQFEDTSVVQAPMPQKRQSTLQNGVVTKEYSLKGSQISVAKFDELHDVEEKKDQASHSLMSQITPSDQEATAIQIGKIFSKGASASFGVLPQPYSMPQKSEHSRNGAGVSRYRTADKPSTSDSRAMLLSAAKQRNFQQRIIRTKTEERQSRRQPQPQVVISVNCSKAMTMTNYRSLAKMVTKHRKKQADHSAQPGQKGDEREEENGKSFFYKQKMLQSRIEKLRQLEGKIGRDTVCTKKNCPVSLDPRTTQERYGNDTETAPEAVPGYQMRERIERFRNTQHSATHLGAQGKGRRSKGLTSQDGSFNLKAEDRNIKMTAADEVLFNFMRRHQVVQETADIPLSELIRQNQDRAIHNMQKSQTKLAGREADKSPDVPSLAYGQEIGSMAINIGQYKSANVICTQPEGATPLSYQSNLLGDGNMARTHATQMNSRYGADAGKGSENLYQRGSMQQSDKNLDFSKHSSASKQRKSSMGVGSRRSNLLNTRNLGLMTKTEGSNGFLERASRNRTLRNYGSVELMQRAYGEILRSPSPELEEKDEFAASSLWQLAAKANQEDFKEIFKSEPKHETSEELETKLVELVRSKKNGPTIDSSRQVSPRTIKYLCNVLSGEKPANLPQKDPESKRNGSIPLSYMRKSQGGDQRTGNQLQSQANESRSNTRFATEEDEEDQYDSKGQVSQLCRPLIKDQRDKIVTLLQNKKPCASKQTGKMDSTFDGRTELDQIGVPNFIGSTRQKSMALVMQLQKELDASPSTKAKKHKAKTKNEILEMCESQFPSDKTHEATMYGRAMKMYAKSKEREGFQKQDVIQPETIAHFHIEAFGDQIEVNRYESQRPLPFHALSSLQVDPKACEHLDRALRSKSFKSSYDVIDNGRSPAQPAIKIAFGDINTQKTDVEPLASAAISRRSSSFGGESQDSVYSYNMRSMPDNFHDVLAESPELPKRQSTKRSGLLSKLTKNFSTKARTAKALVDKPGGFKTTLLLTKEQKVEQENYIKMDLVTLNKLTRQQSILAFKTLSVALKPIFSGSVDHRINLLDYKKVHSLFGLGRDNLSQTLGKAGANLMGELQSKMASLKERQIFHGYWEQINETQGCLPDNRKGASMSLVGDDIYIFGGFSRDTYNDLKVFNIDTLRWREVQPSLSRVIPEKRVSHTMVTYGDKLVLFGGGGQFIENLHMMPSFNDIWMFETKKQRWHKLEGSGIPPKKRTQHVSAMMGSLMLIHGGYNCEGKVVLDDFNLIDLEEHKWVKTRVIMNGKVIESDAQQGSTLDTEDSDCPKVPSIGSRMDHCMTSVFLPTHDRYALIAAQSKDFTTQQRGNLGNSKERARRGMWIYDRAFSKEEVVRGKEFKEGFYMFGGKSRDEEKLNDLWLIRPEHYTNKRMIDDVKFQFTNRDPELTLNVKKITDFSGQPPCPRTGASMVHIEVKKTGHQLLVIYGGRNDQIFQYTGSVALNDICIFNINLCQWEALAIFGQHPMARWKHTMVPMSDEQTSRQGFLVFGGTNLSCYCRSKVFQFSLMNKKRPPNKTGAKAKKESNKDMVTQGKPASSPFHMMNDSAIAPSSQVHFQAEHDLPPSQVRIRDDVSQKSAIRSSFAKRNRESTVALSSLGAGVNFANRLAEDAQSQASRRLNTHGSQNTATMQKQGLQGQFNYASSGLDMSFVGHAETVTVKDPTKLQLGRDHADFYETVKHRVDILRDQIQRLARQEIEAEHQRAKNGQKSSSNRR